MNNTMNTYTHMDLPCSLATNQNHPMMAACSLLLCHRPLSDGPFSSPGLQTRTLVAIQAALLENVKAGVFFFSFQDGRELVG